MCQGEVLYRHCNSHVAAAVGAGSGEGRRGPGQGQVQGAAAAVVVLVPHLSLHKELPREVSRKPW